MGYHVLCDDILSRFDIIGLPQRDRRTDFFLSSSFYVPPSHTSAEACLVGWPNAQPQGCGKCRVARDHQACLTVCMKCRRCATSLFLERGVYKG